MRETRMKECRITNYRTFLLQVVMQLSHRGSIQGINDMALCNCLTGAAYSALMTWRYAIASPGQHIAH